MDKRCRLEIEEIPTHWVPLFLFATTKRCKFLRSVVCPFNSDVQLKMYSKIYVNNDLFIYFINPIVRH